MSLLYKWTLKQESAKYFLSDSLFYMDYFNISFYRKICF